MGKTLKRRKSRLTNVDVSELSFVDSPAVQRTFLLWKRNDGGVNMKLEKDKNLLILEQASEALDTTIEKFSKEDKLDAMALAKEAAGLIIPVIQYCTDTIVEKTKPESLAKEKEVEYSNFVKWNSFSSDPVDVVKTWTDWSGGKAEVKYLWFPPAPPPVVKKREELTEDELAKDFGEVVEVVKTGKKISKKNAELIKNAIATLTSLLQEIEGVEKKEDPPKVDPPKVEEDPIEKEIAALPAEEQKEVMKSLENIKAIVDSMEKK